mmetsp:Transcript_13494/g.19821  ORF Transcript_13494/g.19821 Transcript_13494/m.19821 type:complete len:344 (-) Transcript_13494:239-1270(-)
MAEKNSSSQDFEAPWIEKYRPTVLDDVVGNEDTIERLKCISVQGNLPNVIIAGPPGTGKTTSIHCLARSMLGDAYKNAVLELNASDARGIDVVRNKIKMFAQKKVTLPPGRHKIIILDEADSMTSQAQQALRRTMEIYSNTTRFALACNNSEKVIEPIQSRCAILRYAKLADEEVLQRLQEVCQAEKLDHEPAGLEALIFTAEGDMRNALNNLQATNSGFGSITSENVFKVCDQPHPLRAKSVLNKCLENDIYGAKQDLEDLWESGYSAMDIIGTLFRVGKQLEVEESSKLAVLREIGLAHMRIAEGLNSLLQLLGLLGRLCLLSAPAKAEAAAGAASAMETS